VSPAIAATNPAAVLRVTRYGARTSVTESHLSYDADRTGVKLVSDATKDPRADLHHLAAAEILA
jgi:hypothetical protein